MQTQGPAPTEPPHDDALTGAADDWARPMLDRELVILGRLAEAAVALAEAMTRQVTQAQDATSNAASDAHVPSPIFKGDIALGFSRVSRAVRMTVALQARLIGELQALERAQARDARMAAFDDEKAREALRRERKARVARVLTRIVEDEVYPESEGEASSEAESEAESEAFGESDADPEGETYARLIREASECLQDRDRFGDVLSRPVSEFIDLVCRDLGLAPDWRRLAEEAWAQEEMRSGEVGAPLASIKTIHPGARRDPGFFSRETDRAGPAPASPTTENTWVPTSIGMSGGDLAASP